MSHALESPAVSARARAAQPGVPVAAARAGGDADLAAQAVPGHGVPSHDPDPAAQHAITPEHAHEEARSVYTGAGALAGAALGTAVAGPVGVVVGGTLGAVAGALGGAATGAVAQDHSGPPAPEAQTPGGTAPRPAAGHPMPARG